MADFPKLKFSSPSLNDDRNNPLFIFGQNSIQNLLEFKNSGKQKGKFGPENPFGFTPKVEFYVNPNKTYLSSPNGPELPVEYGISLAFRNDNDKFQSDPNTKVKQKKEVLDNFSDQRTKDFTHSLDSGNKFDRTIPTDSGTSTKEIYLGSYISTTVENEDPTILGFDLIIDIQNSPLFNGAVIDFIEKFSGITEVASRRQIYQDFLNQFNKFFNFNSSEGNLSAKENKKSYYLKQVDGLKALMEQNTSNDQKKSFVAYNTDKIKLKLMEDVSQSMGYLSSLYKSLSWSRLNGKQVIPPNLLRFNIDIVVSEVRNYNRVIKFRTDGGEALRVYSDLISKYTYSLYDCQFYFPQMPHGDSINIEVTSGTTLKDYDIEFDFKFSSMKFEKFNFDLVNRTGDDIRVTSDFIDNKLTNPKAITPIDTNRFSSNGFSLELLPKSQNKSSYAQYDVATRRYIRGNTTFEGFSADTINALKQRAKTEDQLRPLTRLRNDLIRAGANALNRKIVTQARLLNKTLDKIRNTLPFASRMSEPTNVYKSNQLSLRTDVINAARNFVGRSIRSFFTPPAD
jgi:hypothetical protein